MKKRGLEGLACWEESKELSVFVCGHMLPKFPLEEKWALASQLRRSIQSIPPTLPKRMAGITTKKEYVLDIS